MPSHFSPLHKKRLIYKTTLPSVLSGSLRTLQLSVGEKTRAIADTKKLEKIFPHTFGQSIVHVKKGKSAQKDIARVRRVGVLLSGGPAAGGHNVICGLFDAMIKLNASSRLIGFLGGPSGLIENKKINIDASLVEQYRNSGGFDIIGSGRTKIETPEQFASSLKTVQKNKLDAIVVIGGDDSNTNAALLAEYFSQHKSTTQVIGIPKTIDGDLKNKYIESSFGFDTATKTYSELVGNIARDAASSGKYWHFIRLMGRSASHITLECALQTSPNITLISEEVRQKKLSLHDIVSSIADIIEARAKKKMNYGVVLIPEGLIEFIPEIGALIAALNDVLAHDTSQTISERMKNVTNALPAQLHKTFTSLPQGIKEQLLLDRDAHGNVQVSLIETEQLLLAMTRAELMRRKEQGTYNASFGAQKHFFGYEARCAFPSNFDANYCYALGYNAFVLITHKLSGYMSSITNLIALNPKEWRAGGVPLSAMMNIERRHGRDKPVIRKALVDLKGIPFKTLSSQRRKWASTTSFRYPGPLQYFGDASISDIPTITLVLEHKPKK